MYTSCPIDKPRPVEHIAQGALAVHFRTPAIVSDHPPSMCFQGLDAQSYECRRGLGRILAGVCRSQSKMFALVYQTLDLEDKMFGLALCDVRSNEWYKLAIGTPYIEHSFITRCASDGGLVCIISRVKVRSFKGPLVIIVWQC